MNFMLRRAFSFFSPLLIISFFSCSRLIKPKYNRGVYTSPEIIRNNKKFPWFTEGYAAYVPDGNTVVLLSQKITSGDEILVFGGTWCSDTHNLLPKFYKTMNQLPQQPKITLVLVDRSKKSGKGIEASYNIEYVPTFIVLRNQKEIGRVVESVSKSIEADLLEIMSK